MSVQTQHNKASTLLAALIPLPECMRTSLTAGTQYFTKSPMTFQLTQFLAQLPDALECGQPNYTAVISFDSPANSGPQTSKEDISVQPVFHIL
jgi:hypothetical protein